jgi:DNA-directed RNA polymerase specialized sigma24 family protein
MAKEVKRTPLDDAYARYWAHPSSRPPTDDLLAAVRTFTLRMTRYDEDVAQNVCMIVYQGLEGFRLADETAFTRWVRSIIKRVRLEAFRTSSLHTRAYDESTLPVHDDDEYIDVSHLPNDIQLVAYKLLAGYKVKEIADQLGITNSAMKKRLQRFRESMSPNVMSPNRLESHQSL